MHKEKYIPFARKYRPSDFSELKGQEVLVKTLSYCIENNRLAQAYLLTGIRGVGKTSSARIIAKTINCTNLKISPLSPVKPCNECTNCHAVNSGSHPDILEIDAASKTSVDDIRSIIQSCEYRPLTGRYKFFIIDEIHMLSKSAFNALLKIVEEPPEHIIFIFATTEVQKIPLTVISRCQRYDLRRLNFEEIYKLLQVIAQKENIDCEIEALKIIANKSEGSARDAIAILDQAASYLHNSDGSAHITGELVGRMLGLLRMGVIVKFGRLIIAGNTKEAIDLLNEIYFNSGNLELFVQAMSDFFAELCKAKVINDYSNPLLQDYLEEILTITIGTSLSRLTILQQIFSNGASEVKLSHNGLITTEMLLIKAIYSCNLPEIEEIMDAESYISNYNSAAESFPIAKNSGQKSTPSLPKISKEAEPRPDLDEDIFNFLKYCLRHKEMDIYYELLNNIEIVEFKDCKAVFNGNISNELLRKIGSVLNIWAGTVWQVSCSKKDRIFSLKEKMLEKAKQAENYQIIKKYFPEADISDIIFKS